MGMIDDYDFYEDVSNASSYKISRLFKINIKDKQQFEDLYFAFLYFGVNLYDEYVLLYREVMINLDKCNIDDETFLKILDYADINYGNVTRIEYMYNWGFNPYQE